MSGDSHQISISIDKAVIADLPVVVFPGKIEVIDTEEKAERAVAELMEEKVVGFDTETRPSFRKGKVNNVALMQIATAGKCYLFRINILGITPALRMFIEDSAVVKVGLSLKDDFMVMHRSEMFNPAAFIDLQSFVKQYHIVDMSLQRIYAILFGERISKHQRLTNWEAPELTDGQQAYAAIDAWASLRIYNHLNSGLFKPEESRYILKDTPPAI